MKIKKILKKKKQPGEALDTVRTRTSEHKCDVRFLFVRSLFLSGEKRSTAQENQVFLCLREALPGGVSLRIRMSERKRT